MKRIVYTAFLFLFAISFQPVLADELSDYRDYLVQFSEISSVSLSAEYSRSMTVDAGSGAFFNAVASGDFMYDYSGGRFRVDCNIIAKNDESQVLEQIASYYYNGKEYEIENITTGVQQQFVHEPKAGVDLPVNPLLINIAYIAKNIEHGTLLGLEHFSDLNFIDNALSKATVGSDLDGEHYVLISDEIEQGSLEYRIYLKNFDGVSSKFMLPYRQTMYMDNVEIAVIHTSEYMDVSSGGASYCLPAHVSFVFIENDEPVLEYSAIIDQISMGQVDDALFEAEVNNSLAQIDENGYFQTVDGRAAHVDTVYSPSPTESEVLSSQKKSLKWVFALGSIGLLAGLVFTYRKLKFA